MSSTLSSRQQEIIKVSLELIAERGIQNLTIKNLSKKLGIVESAIYRHYESKIQILIAIIDKISEKTKLNDTKDAKNIISFLEKRLKNHFLTFAKNPALVSVVFAEDLFQNEALLVKKTKTKLNKSISELSALIKVGQQKGEIRHDIDSEQFSIMINGSVRMLVKQWKMSGYSFDLLIKGNELVKTLKLLLKL
ncbi:MAG: TetR/AcrR family transcriptional regulator [Bacteroidota bacterium]|nr:TetR/AcrR family transcriptional regulator [Bacteroidota bacterium]